MEYTDYLETPDLFGSVTKDDTSLTGPQAPQFSSEASEALIVPFR
jgi:hypothetical protein